MDTAGGFERLRARMGGLALAAQQDPRVYTQKARDAFRNSFLDSVDPSGELRRRDPGEAERRAEAARRLHYARLSMKSAQARRSGANKGKRIATLIAARHEKSKSDATNFLTASDSHSLREVAGDVGVTSNRS